MGHVTGVKFFLISQSPPFEYCSSQRSLHHQSLHYQSLRLLQIDDFWKSWLDGKRLWGSDFLDFLLPKTCPHMGHLTGVNIFLIYQSRLDMCCGTSQRSLHYVFWKGYMWVTSVGCKLQNNDFWKSSLGLKPLWGWKFWDFSLPFFSPHYAELMGGFFFDTSRSSMWYSGVTIILHDKNWNTTLYLRFLWEIQCEKWSDHQIDIE